MVLEVVDVEYIRKLRLRDGLSVRAVARRLRLSRTTVAKYLAMAEVTVAYQRQRPVLQPKQDEVRSVVMAWLEADADAPAKQRHTARRVHERLREELDVQISERTVNRLVAAIRAQPAKAYLPLAFAPGELAQADFGEAEVVVGGVRIKVWLFVMRLGASGASFVMAVARPNRESFLEGHIRAFHFFGGVPLVIWYDNLGLAVKLIGPAGARVEQDAFSAFRAHYLFDAHYCNLGEEGAHEKGLVENLVRLVRNHALVPVPQVDSLDHLNRLLADFSQRDLGRVFRVGEQTIGARLNEERRQMLALPDRDADPSRAVLVKVTSQALCHFERCRYSVPDHLAGATLTIHAHWDRLIFSDGQEVVAEHARLYGVGLESLQWEHYLRLLSQRPGGVVHARVFARLEGPYRTFRDHTLARGDGREFSRLLGLYQDYRPEVIQKALLACIETGVFQADAVREGCRRLVEVAPIRLSTAPSLEPFAADPSVYDQLFQPAVGAE